jgi:tRNA pseudouridine55 synthase
LKVEVCEGTILAVRKPPGISSFGAVAWARRITGIHKVGHAGTLDPFAEGVLVLGFGRAATRQLGELSKTDKEYIADIRLGIMTDTGDPTGKVIQSAEVPEITEEDARKVLDGFLGEQSQVPPRFSAIQVDGQRLYHLARKGRLFEVQPRTIHIHELEYLGMAPGKLSFRVVCGHGTYNRSLAEDIGKALNTVAHLERLVRTRVGSYCLDDAYAIDTLTGVRQSNGVLVQI